MLKSTLCSEASLALSLIWLRDWAWHSHVGPHCLVLMAAFIALVRESPSADILFLAPSI